MPLATIGELARDGQLASMGDGVGPYGGMTAGWRGIRLIGSAEVRKGVGVGSREDFDHLGEVSVGLGPETVVLNTATRRGYVACPRSSAVSVFDLDSHATAGTVPVGREPIAVILDPVTGWGHTADARTGTVTSFDAATLEVLGQVEVGRYPAGLGVYPARRKLYVGNTADATVSVVNLDGLRLVATVPAGQAVGHLGADPRLDRCYGVNFGQGSLTVIDGASDQALAEIAVDSAPCKITVDSAAGVGYVANSLVGKPLPEFALPELGGDRVRRSLEWAKKRYRICFFASS